MIKLSGSLMPQYNVMDKYPSESIKGKILNKLSLSEVVYKYASLSELEFELDLRSYIINSAIELNESKLSFKIFRKSICNDWYWERTDEGGFLQRENVSSSEAISDIFINGIKYGTECSTAIVIIYYKAILDKFGENLFNKLFNNIHLMNWHYIDRDIKLNHYSSPTYFIPGDCLYFKNPDVNPLKPEWQGENVIDLGNDTYYGHGVGIKSREEIIKLLNNKRKKGAENSAYLLDSSQSLDFHYFNQMYQDSALRFNSNSLFHPRSTKDNSIG